VNQKAEELKARTKAFALDVIRFVHTLPPTIAAQEMGRELLRSRLGVAAELWLELFSESNLPNVMVPDDLVEESRPMRTIFVASNLTARRPDH
jgi:hypothetical protein